MTTTSATAEKTEYSKKTKPVEIALNECTFFHDPDEEAYVVFPVREHFECWPANSKTFRRWLSGRTYTVTSKAPKRSAILDEIEALESHAIFENDEEPVFLRSARVGDEIYYDLGDVEWREVRVTASGWSIGESHSVNFVRNSDMESLPFPTKGGTVDALRPLLNLRTEEEWHLLVGFILAALNPEGPYPVLVVQGEQGSAKTMLSVGIRRFIDPSSVPEQGFTTDERNIMIAAKGNRLVCFDNVSRIPQGVSDVLCRIASGAGFRHRTLYSDTDETSFMVKRPIVLNGIEEFVASADLADRSIQLALTRIPDDERITETEFWEEFNRVAPQVMGALLDAVSQALRIKDSQRPDKLPRLAETAIWVDAGETALGFKRGTFRAALDENRSSIRRSMVELNPIADAINVWFERRDLCPASLTASEVISEISPYIRDLSNVPKDARQMASELERIAPVLESVGIRVQRGQRTPGRRVWEFSPIE